MAISNNSTGLRPGVCTSTTRPTAPYEGQHIYETDTDLVYLWNGSAWVETVSALTKAPRGVMSFVEKTSNTAGVTTETVIVTLPSFTAVANRYYRVTGMLGIVYSSPAANNSFTARIRKGTTTSGTALQTADVQVASAASGQQITIIWTGTLTAGAQQMVLTGEATAGSSWFGSATQPLQFLIEDIGAV